MSQKRVVDVQVEDDNLDLSEAVGASEDNKKYFIKYDGKVPVKTSNFAFKKGEWMEVTKSYYTNMNTDRAKALGFTFKVE